MKAREKAGGPKSRLWIVDTRPIPNLFPELTESAFAQLVSRAKRVIGAARAVLAKVAQPLGKRGRWPGRLLAGRRRLL